MQLRGQRRVEQALVLRRLPAPGHVAVGAVEDHQGDQPLRVSPAHHHCRALLEDVGLCTPPRRAHVHNNGSSPGHSLHEVAVKADIHVATASALLPQGVCHQVPHHPLQPANRQRGEAGRQAAIRSPRRPEARRPQLRLAGDCLLLAVRWCSASGAQTEQQHTCETAPLQHAHINDSKHNVHMAAQQHALMQYSDARRAL